MLLELTSSSVSGFSGEPIFNEEIYSPWELNRILATLRAVATFRTWTLRSEIYVLEVSACFASSVLNY